MSQSDADALADVRLPIEALAEAANLTSTATEESPSTTFRDVMNCFLSTFVTIFLAELGDKTQLATLLMSAQSHKPWMVFLGAATALVATSLVGVLLGRWLSTVLTPRTLERVTGVILAIVAVGLVIDIVQG